MHGDLSRPETQVPAMKLSSGSSPQPSQTGHFESFSTAAHSLTADLAFLCGFGGALSAVPVPCEASTQSSPSMSDPWSWCKYLRVLRPPGGSKTQRPEVQLDGWPDEDGEAAFCVFFLQFIEKKKGGSETCVDAFCSSGAPQELLHRIGSSSCCPRLLFSSLGDVERLLTHSCCRLLEA